MRSFDVNGKFSFDKMMEYYERKEKEIGGKELKVTVAYRGSSTSAFRCNNIGYLLSVLPKYLIDDGLFSTNDNREVKKITIEMDGGVDQK